MSYKDALSSLQVAIKILIDFSLDEINQTFSAVQFVTDYVNCKTSEQEQSLEVRSDDDIK